MRGVATVFMVGVAVAVFACGGSQPKTDSSALTLEEFEEGQEEAGEERPASALDETPEPGADECRTECRSEEDCCEGYYCGKDPERSHRLDFCMPM
jgi:hypothetical protein